MLRSLAKSNVPTLSKITLWIISNSESSVKEILQQFGINTNPNSLGFQYTENYNIYYLIDHGNLAAAVRPLPKPNVVVFGVNNGTFRTLKWWMGSIEKVAGSEQVSSKITKKFVANKKKYLKVKSVTSKPFECDQPLGYQFVLFLQDVGDDIQQKARMVGLRHGGAVCAVNLVSVIEEKAEPEAVSGMRLVIPVGYDSVGKIQTVDESFDVEEIAREIAEEIPGEEIFREEEKKFAREFSEDEHEKNKEKDQEQNNDQNKKEQSTPITSITSQFNSFLQSNYQQHKLIKKNPAIDDSLQQFLHGIQQKSRDI